MKTGPNKPVTPSLEQAVGSDVLETLSRQTGLSREELLARLSRELPDAVDKYTPQGRIPSGSEVFASLILAMCSKAVGNEGARGP